MKAKKMFALGIVGLLSLTMLAGCSGSKNDQKASDEVKAAMINSSKVKSESYSLKLDGKITVDEEAESTAEFKELNGSIDLSGVFDMKTKDNPKFIVKIDAKGSVDGSKEQSIGGEMRLVDKNMYFSVSKLDIDAIPDLYKAAVAGLLNKWWYVDSLGDSFDNLNANTVDEADMTPEQKQLKELAEETRFFKNVVNQGEDTVGGLAATKYAVELDKEVFVNYLAEVEKISGTADQRGDIAELESFMKLVNFKGFAWVTKDDQMFRKLDGTVTIEPSKETDNAGFEFQFGYAVDDLDKDLKVEIPAGAEKFDLGKILGMPAVGEEVK